MKNHIARLYSLTLVLLSGLVFSQFASAQSFKKIKVANNTPLAQVASGGASVWALASNGHPYIFKGKSFALANSITLSQIAVGGGNSAQADAVWALDTSGNVNRATKSGTTWTFSPITHSGGFTAIAAGPGYQDSCHPYEIWALNSGSQIFRYNFCGLLFDQVPGFLCDIKVGGGEIWGPQCGPNVFHFNFTTGVFDQISDPFGAFPALTVGPNGEVWAIDTGTSGLYRHNLFGGGWGFFGTGATQVQAGGDGVWVLVGNQILRWQPSDLTFREVPGSLSSLSVGSGGGVWGLDGSGKVYAFSTP